MSDSELDYMHQHDDSDSDFEDEVIKKTTRAPLKERSLNAPKAVVATAKKPVAPPPKKSSALKIAEDDTDDDAPAPPQQRSSEAIEAISNKFQKKTQVEHILLRPDTYIGSVEKITQKMWVLASDNQTLEERDCTFVPGLYKIFDEILVNAADNHKRDSSMSMLKVEINRATGEISVLNDGKGIPIEMHQKEKIYIPELIFGHLLTGENFDDASERVVGGRNGYGAKLTNIFSHRFELETQDGSRSYKQVWKSNMSVCEPAKVGKASSSKDFTKVTFLPDYERFGMPEGLDEDHMALLQKRVYDMAGVTDKGIKVSLNGELLTRINTFEKMIDLYLQDSKTPKIYTRVNERWEVCVAASPDGSFTQTSFVNSICTYKGGTHVLHIADQVTKHVLGAIPKKKKDLANVLKPALVKNHLWIFVNALIVNPTFDSQTKESLTTRPNKFGPPQLNPTLDDAFLAKVVKSSGIMENVLYWAEAKQSKDLKKVGGPKTTSKFLDIPKLDDANNAGTKKAKDCTLILTEGDSAKTLALSGISVVGRDNYGVFPLKGKLLNVRDAPVSQVAKNAEIQNLLKILGLRIGEKYLSTEKLRYGHVMIMTDQDQDGSHIKGLLFNFFQHFFPDLLQIPNYLRVFVTPIVKVTKSPTNSLAFYTLHEYAMWRDRVQAEAEANFVASAKQLADQATARKRAGELALKAWRVKYYKGLGTNSSKEAQEYFSALKKHVIDMAYSQASNDAIDMAFAKHRVEDRKKWLSSYDAVNGPRVDFKSNEMDYHQFVHGELVHFSLGDNVRSIPSVFDGLKPSQRKVLYACFKRKLVQEIKVSQLSGYISENACYHHGEESLAQTIVGMAQNFPGSNNIALMHAGGAFGTRRMGGKDSASPRYIHTRLEKITRLLFHPDDDALFPQLEDDGQLIEPRYYVPVIPTVLVNGSSGIGTGWSTEIPCFNPRDVIKAVRRRVLGLESSGMLLPWYRGSRCVIEPEVNKKTGTLTGRFTARGVFSFEGNTITITELPIGKWTAAYKEWLVECITEADASAAAARKSAKAAVADIENADNGFMEAAAAPTGKAAASSAPGFKGKVIPAGSIKSFREYHTDETVEFEIDISDSFAALLQKGGDDSVVQYFHLQSIINFTNMNAFDSKGLITKYESPEAIMDAFMPVRREVYVARKKNLETILGAEVEKLSSQARFVRMVVDGELVVAKKKKAELLTELSRLGFPLVFKGKAQDQNAEEAAEGQEEETSDKLDPGKGYDYLLSMPLWSLTLEKVRALEDKAADKASELEMLKQKSTEEFWIEDLDALDAALDEMDKQQEAARLEQEKARAKAGRKPLSILAPRSSTTTMLLPPPAARSANSGMDMEEVVEVVAPPAKKAPAPKRAPALKPKPPAVEESLSLFPPLPAIKAATNFSLFEPLNSSYAPMPTKATKPTTKKVLVSDDEDDEDLALMSASLATKMVVTPRRPEGTTKAGGLKRAKVPTPIAQPSSNPIEKKSRAASGAAVAKRIVRDESTDEEEEFDDDETEEEDEEDSEEEDEDESSEEEDDDDEEESSEEDDDDDEDDEDDDDY